MSGAEIKRLEAEVSAHRSAAKAEAARAEILSETLRGISLTLDSAGIPGHALIERVGRVLAERRGVEPVRRPALDEAMRALIEANYGVFMRVMLRVATAGEVSDALSAIDRWRSQSALQQPTVEEQR